MQTQVFRRAFGALFAAALPVFAVEAAPFAPHEATYRMSLVKADSSAGLRDVRGLMQYRFADVCDGWVSENAFAVEYIYESGASERRTWTFTSWEAKAGDKMRFTVTEKTDGALTDTFAGRAEVDPAGGAAGTAWFDAAAGVQAETINLPPGTLLPTRHMSALFKAAAGGAPIILHTVFDGSSRENPYTVNTVIGQGRAASADFAAPPGGGDADALRTYPMRLAFFPLRGGDAAPEFEMTVHYREDGVAERVTQDFEHFSVALEPDEIRFTGAGGC
ncbi:MAG: EipB family protein [Rhodospirillales bacterium]